MMHNQQRGVLLEWRMRCCCNAPSWGSPCRIEWGRFCTVKILKSELSTKSQISNKILKKVCRISFLLSKFLVQQVLLAYMIFSNQVHIFKLCWVVHLHHDTVRMRNELVDSHVGMMNGWWNGSQCRMRESSSLTIPCTPLSQRLPQKQDWNLEFFLATEMPLNSQKSSLHVKQKHRI